MYGAYMADIPSEHASASKVRTFESTHIRKHAHSKARTFESTHIRKHAHSTARTFLARLKPASTGHHARHHTCSHFAAVRLEITAR
jgi:hypothetical protein